MADVKQVSGALLGAYAKHPFFRRIDSDLGLKISFGKLRSGAVMAVPNVISATGDLQPNLSCNSCGDRRNKRTSCEQMPTKKVLFAFRFFIMD